MTRLTAKQVYSLKAKDYDGKFWVTVEFQNKTVKVEGFSRCEDETDNEMRKAGYIYIENSHEYGKELWISLDDLCYE